MASAKQTRINQMVSVLEQATTWVPAATLSKRIGASERSVRNYVAEINAQGIRRIESSKEGYRLARQRRRADGEAARAAGSGTEKDRRRNHVITRLIQATEPVSMFDLADELYISESTLASSVMPQVRRLCAEYGLACESHDFQLVLTGRERNKRRLLGGLATSGFNGYFSSTQTLEELFPEYDVKELCSRIVDICQRSELFINDYALTNLLVHLMVMIIRLTSDNELPEGDFSLDAQELVDQLDQRDDIVRCADRIAAFVEKECGIPIPQADYQQILMLLVLSVERVAYRELDLDILAEVIDPAFIETVFSILDETAARYGLDTLGDNTTRLQLVLHLYNAYQRAKYGVSYPNPLATQIKGEYAPVYDMAVYIAHRFSTAMGVPVGENEIAFIAFHIGAYFDRIASPSNAVSCVIVVDEYHDLGRRLVQELKGALGEELDIAAVMSSRAYAASPVSCDLVITTADVPTASHHKVLIGPFLNKQGIQKTRKAMEQILEERRLGDARDFLRGLLSPELYLRNVAGLECAEDAIERLGELVVASGQAGEDFVEDVQLRERVSSTAFSDCLAVPHSISVFPERSFVAVIHNDEPIPWGKNHRVNFVLLMGIVRKDMGIFHDALDLIIETFASVEHTTRLLRTNTYDEFVAALG